MPQARSAPKPSAELARALNLAKTGRRREAIVLLTQLAEQRPKDDMVWFYLGATLDASAKEAKAIPCYLRALRLKPLHPYEYEMCLYLCSSYRKTKRPQAASRWLKKAQSLSQSTPLQKRLERLLKQ